MDFAPLKMCSLSGGGNFNCYTIVLLKIVLLTDLCQLIRLRGIAPRGKLTDFLIFVSIKGLENICRSIKVCCVNLVHKLLVLCIIRWCWVCQLIGQKLRVIKQFYEHFSIKSK